MPKHIDLSSIAYKNPLKTSVNEQHENNNTATLEQPSNISNTIETHLNKFTTISDNITQNMLKKALENVDVSKTVQNEPTATKVVENDSKNDNEKPKDKTIDRRRMILILQFYLLEFGNDKLHTFVGIDLDSKSDEELTNLKNEFDFIIGARTNIAGTQQMFIQGISLLETICTNYTPLKIQGLATICDDVEFRDDVKHLCLKWISVIKQNPR